MNFIRLSIVLILLFSNLLAEDKMIKMGLLYEKIFTSKKEAEIGSSLWLNQIKKKYPNENFSIIFYEDTKKLLKDYKEKKIDVVISNSIFYLENKEIIDDLTLYKWVTSRTDSMYEQFYLIKNKEKQVIKFCNLVG